MMMFLATLTHDWSKQVRM